MPNALPASRRIRAPPRPNAASRGPMKACRTRPGDASPATLRRRRAIRTPPGRSRASRTSRRPTGIRTRMAAEHADEPRLLDHLIELRARLLRAVAGLGLAL